MRLTDLDPRWTGTPKIVKTIREKAIRLRILGAWINEITNETADANPA